MVYDLWMYVVFSVSLLSCLVFVCFSVVMKSKLKHSVLSAVTLCISTNITVFYLPKYVCVCDLTY